MASEHRTRWMKISRELLEADDPDERERFNHSLELVREAFLHAGYPTFLRTFLCVIQEEHLKSCDRLRTETERVVFDRADDIREIFIRDHDRRY